MIENNDWDISYDIDDLIEPQNKKKNVFAKTPEEITRQYGQYEEWSKFRDKEPYDWIKEQGQYEPFWGYSKEAHIQFMNPDEYLNQIKLIPRNQVNKQHSKEHINQYKTNMEKGAKFPLPWLRYINNEITGQEGIHRVSAAKEIGVKKIPVAILDIDDNRKQSSYESEDIKTFDEIFNKKKKQNPFTFETELI